MKLEGVKEEEYLFRSILLPYHKDKKAGFINLFLNWIYGEIQNNRHYFSFRDFRKYSNWKLKIIYKDYTHQYWQKQLIEWKLIEKAERSSCQEFRITERFKRFFKT
jgi:hypothetical protein